MEQDLFGFRVVLFRFNGDLFGFANHLFRSAENLIGLTQKLPHIISFFGFRMRFISRVFHGIGKLSDPDLGIFLDGLLK